MRIETKFGIGIDRGVKQGMRVIEYIDGVWKIPLDRVALETFKPTVEDQTRMLSKASYESELKRKKVVFEILR